MKTLITLIITILLTSFNSLSQIGYSKEEIIAEYGTASPFSRGERNYSFIFVDNLCAQWEMNTTDQVSATRTTKRLNESFELLTPNTWKIDEFVNTVYLFDKGVHRFITYYKPN